MTPEQREAREHERLISMAFENLPTTTEVTRDDVDAILTWVLPEVRMTPEQQAVIDAVRAWIRTNHEDTAYVTLLDAVQALDCSVCSAKLGEPCTSTLIRKVDRAPVLVNRDRPHTRRQLRTGYARTGVDRG
jgi:ABC-type branched-subunit amino acid transport system substrate-binding protein